MVARLFLRQQAQQETALTDSSFLRPLTGASLLATLTQIAHGYEADLQLSDVLRVQSLCLLAQKAPLKVRRIELERPHYFHVDTPVYLECEYSFDAETLEFDAPLTFLAPFLLKVL